jgi:hypothetical protein
MAQIQKYAGKSASLFIEGEVAGDDGGSAFIAFSDGIVEAVVLTRLKVA